jgi:hypothetical protein
MVDGGRKRFLSGLFRHVEVADEPDQRGDDTAPIRAIKGVDGGSSVRGHSRV